MLELPLVNHDVAPHTNEPPQPHTHTLRNVRLEAENKKREAVDCDQFLITVSEYCNKELRQRKWEAVRKIKIGF